ncbi:GGDEF domain-containing protein [Mangrovibacter sp. SLW1]
MACITAPLFGTGKPVNRPVPPAAYQWLQCFFIELDSFKHINDTLGHTYGDALLRKFSARLREFSDDNTWFCRWGGNEFIFATALTDPGELYWVADAMLVRFGMPYRIDEQQVSPVQPLASQSALNMAIT